MQNQFWTSTFLALLWTVFGMSYADLAATKIDFGTTTLLDIKQINKDNSNNEDKRKFVSNIKQNNNNNNKNKMQTKLILF